MFPCNCPPRICHLPGSSICQKDAKDKYGISNDLFHLLDVLSTIEKWEDKEADVNDYKK